MYVLVDKPLIGGHVAFSWSVHAHQECGSSSPVVSGLQSCCAKTAGTESKASKAIEGTNISIDVVLTAEGVV